MTQRQNIIAAIDAAERHLLAIKEQVRAKADASLGEGTWTVRDLLCHIATTASIAELGRRVENAAGVFPTNEEMDAYNEALRVQHAHDSVDALLALATQGFAESRATVEAMTDDDLARPTPGNEAMTTGDLLAFVFTSHTGPHIETLERAVGAALVV